MNRKKPAALHPAEVDLREALQRLQSGTPKNKELRAAQKLGRLKINFSSVAKEAGRSRTLIALENCRFPATRELIQQVIEGRSSSPRTSAQLISALRRDLAEERTLKRNALEQAQSHFKLREAAEKQARHWKREYDKLFTKMTERQRENVVRFPT